MTMSIKTIGIYAYTKSAHETVGGIEAQITHISRNLAELGYKVVIHCLAGDEVGIRIDENNDFVFEQKVESYNENIKVFRPCHGPGIEGAIEENIRISSENKEDIILCFGTRDKYVFDLAIAAKEKLQVPLVSFVYFTVEERWYRSQFTSRARTIYGLASEGEQETFFTEGENTLKNIVEKSSLVIVPTHYVRGQLVALTGVQKSHKIKVCYHGVDDSLFMRTSQKKWQAEDDLLIVARLSIPFSCDKGFLWAAKFFSDNRNQISQSRIRFCGAGNAVGIIKKFSDKNGLGNQIDATGYVDQKTLVSIYSNSSFLLIPSMMEAGCTAAVEAVMCGCMPIALDSAGLAEIMESLGLDDYIVPGRSKALSAGLNTIVPNDRSVIDLLHKLQADRKKVALDMERARQIASGKFTLNATTARLIGIIKEM